ncbi:MAG TPA: hypothetical protein VGH14_19280 [Solirubrobacterales bacterium]|jgi:hypothetical protein
MFITLDNDVDPRALDVLQGTPGVRLAQGAPQSAIVTDRELIPVDIRVVDAGELESSLEPPGTGRATLLAVNAILDSRAAGRLEDAGINYVDAGGRYWYRGAGKTELGWERKSRQGGRRLYPATVRLAQLLADHPAEQWSERILAKRGRSTQTTAHKLFVRLEREGIVAREGQGRGSVRSVRDPPAMRRWLAREGRPRSATMLECYLRDPYALPRLPGRSFALTGAAGAAELGISVATDQPRPMVRVNVKGDELEDIPEALGGFRTTEGANLVLVADPDRLAFVDQEHGPGAEWHFTAPPSRILLDLYLEPRGEAAADIFLSLWGARELRR